MKTHSILRKRLLKLAGVDAGPSLLEQLRESEWSPRFEQLMRNRLIMGFFRYGPFDKQNRTTEQVLSNIEKRIKEYRKTGNDELLVDVANLAMKEFVVGKHPNKHFKSEDDGEHA